MCGVTGIYTCFNQRSSISKSSTHPITFQINQDLYMGVTKSMSSGTIYSLYEYTIFETTFYSVELLTHQISLRRFDSPPTIMISLDGFRRDYLDRGLTPNLQRLMDCGTSADYMRPAFPSLTFPNHYTLVTVSGRLFHPYNDIATSKYFPHRWSFLPWIHWIFFTKNQ